MQAAKKAKKARQQAKKREDAAGGSICTAQEEEEMERYFAEEAAALPCHMTRGALSARDRPGDPGKRLRYDTSTARFGCAMAR